MLTDFWVRKKEATESKGKNAESEEIRRIERPKVIQMDAQYIYEDIRQVRDIRNLYNPPDKFLKNVNWSPGKEKLLLLHTCLTF